MCDDPYNVVYNEWVPIGYAFWWWPAKTSYCWWKDKGKVSPYSLPSVGPRADPGVQAVSRQVTFKAIHPAVGCQYFPSGLLLPSLPNSVTAHWPVPNYTAWWHRHMRVTSWLKAVTWKRTGRDSNPLPFWVASERSTIKLKFHTEWVFLVTSSWYPREDVTWMLRGKWSRGI